MGMAPPKKAHPRTEFVTLRLTTTEAADLDTYAQTLGTNRSTAVRRAVERVIAAERRRAAKQSAAQAEPTQKAD
jgi:hypothetical protein